MVLLRRADDGWERHGKGFFVQGARLQPSPTTGSAMIPSGKLKMGLIPTIGPYLLPASCRRFAGGARNVLMLYEYQTEALLKRPRAARDR